MTCAAGCASPGGRAWPPPQGRQTGWTRSRGPDLPDF